MSASKVERLLNLSAALLAAGRPLTAEEIQARVPGYPEDLLAFRRAFSRDKDDLRVMGIPLRMERVERGTRTVEGYRIPPEEYALRDPGLEPDELAALHLAANVVKLEGVTFGGVSGLDALRSLGDPAPAQPVNDEAVPSVRLPVDERLTALFAAMTERHPVEFDYQGTHRSFEPHRLDYQRGRWYVSGHDRTRDEPRSFRIDRIVGDVDVVAAEQFAPAAQPHPGLARQPWELGGEDPLDALLLVDAGQAAWATRHLGADAIDEQRPDGAVVFRLRVANRDAFRSFVLTFLDHAEVLGPPELRDDLLAWLASVP